MNHQQSMQRNRTPSHIMNAPDHSRNRADRKIHAYKPGVQVIYGIPYTLEEQKMVMSMEEIKDKIITLCKDQHKNPWMVEFKMALNSACKLLMLPDANDLISYSVRMSPHL